MHRCCLNILNKNKNLRVSILLAAYESEECTISVTVSAEVRPFVHVMNQRNLSSAKYSRNRGHENKIGVLYEPHHAKMCLRRFLTR